jgi:hypothetical protein
MRRVKAIEKKDLHDLYPGSYVVLLEGGSKSIGQTMEVLLHSLPEVIEVRPVNGSGRFSLYSVLGLYEILRRAGTSEYRYLIAPKAIVQEVDLPGTIEMITPILEDLMPGRYLISQGEGSDYIALYLYYPELTITNSQDQQHTIYDLVVKVRLTDFNSLYEPAIAGKRFSWSQTELEKYYHHSHLNTTLGANSFGAFCLGGSSEFKKFMSALSGEFNEHSFTLFIIQLEAYLMWESLEGKPHITLATLNSTSQSFTPIAFNNTSMVKIIAKEIISQLDSSLLTKVGSSYILNPGLDPSRMREIESNVITKLSSQGYSFTRFNFDTVSGTYRRSNTTSSSRMPSYGDITSGHSTIVKAFNIKPRLIEDNTVSSVATNIVERFSPHDFDEILKVINNWLQISTKIKLNAETSVNAESESIHNSQVSSSSGVLA